MIVNRSFAKVVSVLFFLEFASLFAIATMIINPGFQFSQNPLIRFAGLFFCLLVTAIFYSFISEDEETIKGKDQGNFLIKEEMEYKRLIPIIIVVGIFIAFILFLILRPYGIIWISYFI